MHGPTQWNLDIHIGKPTFSVQISRANNSLTESSRDSEPLEEVMGATLEDSPESLLEEYTSDVINEVDDSDKHIEISEFNTPPRLPIELKPLPTCLRYAFLHGDTEFSVNQ